MTIPWSHPGLENDNVYCVVARACADVYGVNMPDQSWRPVYSAPVAKGYSAALHAKVLKRLRAGETVAAVSADTGISSSTLHRWKREGPARAVEAGAVEARAVVAAPDTTEGLLADMTGPGITDRWGVTMRGPGGVGGGAQRQTGVGVRRHLLRQQGRAGRLAFTRRPDRHRGRRPPNPVRAGRRRRTRTMRGSCGIYIHDDASTGWTRGGISTVIPSDLLRVGGSMYLHAIVNRGFGNVIWTEIWTSDDSGISWQHMGENAKFPAALHSGYAQCWSWDYDPDDGWVYMVSTGFQRDKGIILMTCSARGHRRHVEVLRLGIRQRPVGVGKRADADHARGRNVGRADCFAGWQQGKWVLGGFLASKYALGYRAMDSPVANMHDAPIQMPVVGSSWDDEDHANNRVAQLYGGYVLPGSRLDVIGGAGLVVSQWNTALGWPYRAMQFKSTIKDTTTGRHGPVDPMNL